LPVTAPRPITGLAHYLAGLLAGLAPTWWLACLAVALFLAYEYAQYLGRGDDPSSQILEYSLGFYTALALRVLAGA